MPSRRQVLATVGALSVGGAAGCLGSTPSAGSAGTDEADGTTDWPVANFDAMGRSYNPNSVGPAENPTERWRADVGWTIGRPVVADGTAYVPTQTHLHAFDVKTGETRWRLGPTETNDAPRYASPAVHDGTVYVGGLRLGGMLAVDASDGSERWRYEVGDERTGLVAPPLPDDADADGWRSLVVADTDGVVHYLDLESQEPRWSFEVYGSVTHLAVADPVVYVGTEGGEVYALYDGEGLWRRKLPGKITALAAATYNSEVFVSTFGGGVFRLRNGAHAGRTAWHTEHGPVAHEAFVVADDRICGTDLAHATVLGADSGKTAWEVDGDFGVPPAAAGDTLYLGSDAGVTAYKLGGGAGVGDFRFGGKRWHYPFEGSVAGGVTVADDAVFAVDTRGNDRQDQLLVLE